MSSSSGVPWRVACLVVWSTMACRPPEPTPRAEPPSTGAIPSPSDDGDPAPDADELAHADGADGEASPDGPQVDTPTPTLAGVLTVGQAHANAAELVGRTVTVEGTLRWAETHCTKSVPPTCYGQWLLIEGEMVRGPALRLEANNVSVPMVCIETSAKLTPITPCPSGKVLDVHARVLVHGVLRNGAEGPELVVERFEPNGSDAT